MDPVLAAFLTMLGGFLAGSGGFWVYLRKKFEREDCIKQLLMGLAHDKIVFLCIKYIEKGFVTKDEYDDLFKYFWDPYKNVGGNGSAERLIHMVQLLPLNPERRHGDPVVRAAVDKLQKGTDNVIDQLNKGETGLERNKE